MKYYIRCIPSFPSSGKNIEGIFYVEGNHFDAFKNPNNYKLNVLKELHYRLDLFVFDEQSGYQTSNYQNILCLDIDQNRSKKRRIDELDLTAIKSELSDKAGLKEGDYSINSTGYGIHVYLFFDEYFDVSKEPWLRPYLEELSDKIKVKGFQIDRASFNARRSMRFPGSYYIKGEHEGQSEFELHENFLEWKAFKESKQTLTDKTIAKKANDELKTMHLRKDIDWQAIMGPEGEEWSGCRFIRWNWVAANEVNYQEWLAQLTITSRFLKDKTLSYNFCKKFNEGYEKFNEGEFKSKFDEALDNMHPASCDYISSIWRYSKKKGTGCVDCPHKPLNQPLNITSYPNKDTGFRKVSLDKKGGLVPGEINFDSFFKFLRKEHKVFINEDESIWVLNKKHNFYKPESNLYINRNFKHLISNIKTKEMRDLEFRMVRDYYFRTRDEEKKLLGKAIFKNGILDLKSGILHSHDYINVINNYSILFDYDPNAKCPVYDELVEWAFEDTTERDFFFYYIVSSLWTDIMHETAMVLCGEGSNGKSSLMNGIMFMYPEEASVILPFKLGSIVKDDSYLSLLNYSRIAYCSDTNSNALHNKSDLFKQIVSGESLAYRLKFAKAPVKFKNNSKLVLGFNSLPIIDDDSYGLQRRLSVLSFNNRWPAEKKDPYYNKKLKAEGAGIFNLIYKYYLKFIENPKLPIITQKIYKKARKIYDPAYDFFTEYLEFDQDAEKISYQTIYNHFLNYCEKETIPVFKIVQRRSFIHQLKKYSKDKIRIGRTAKDRYIKGVRVLSDEGGEADETVNYMPF